jgi:hypothetical protein
MQALGKDTAQLESYSDAICIDPRLVALRDRIHVEADDTLSETEAHVSLQRRDGKRFEASHDLQAPVDYTDRQARLLEKAQALLGTDTATEVWSVLQGEAAVSDFTRHF